MKKTLIILLTAILALSLFVSCEGDLDSIITGGGSEPVGAKVTITFNANYGETPATTTQEVTKDVETTLTKNTFTSPDVKYIFAGWTTDAEGSQSYYGDGDSVSLTEDLILYAQWGYPLSSTCTDWSNNVYTLDGTEDDVEIADRISVTGTVKLFLPNDTTLTASKGITVTGSNSGRVTFFV